MPVSGAATIKMKSQNRCVNRLCAPFLGRTPTLGATSPITPYSSHHAMSRADFDKTGHVPRRPSRIMQRLVYRDIEPICGFRPGEICYQISKIRLGK